jgi:hypothetical protein
MLTVKKCRKILGEDYNKVPDSKIAEIRDEFYNLRDICTGSYIN